MARHVAKPGLKFSAKQPEVFAKSLLRAGPDLPSYAPQQRWPVRLSVRTPGFQPGKRGSIPLRAATYPCKIRDLRDKISAPPVYPSIAWGSGRHQTPRKPRRTLTKTGTAFWQVHSRHAQRCAGRQPPAPSPSERGRGGSHGWLLALKRLHLIQVAFKTAEVTGQGSDQPRAPVPRSAHVRSARSRVIRCPARHTTVRQTGRARAAHRRRVAACRCPRPLPPPRSDTPRSSRSAGRPPAS